MPKLRYWIETTDHPFDVDDWAEIILEQQNLVLKEIAILSPEIEVRENKDGKVIRARAIDIYKKDADY